MKILVAVGETNRGGTETWLLHIARELRDQCEFDFLVHTDEEGAYDRELQELGVRIRRCTGPRNPIGYARTFLSILYSGPYDIVHSHVQCYSGWILFLAWLGGVPKRIAHAHSDLRSCHRNGGFVRRCYMHAMSCCIRIFATQGLATSANAAASLFGTGWKKDPRWQLHLSCVDLEPFERPRGSGKVRRSLGIPEDAIVIGHVGSFRPEKNHRFALQVAVLLAARSPRYRFLFKGEGALKAQVEQEASDLGIASRCLFLAAGNDVPELLLGAIDLFLFPSSFEGLGLALVEAQAAGLRCFASDGIPREAIAVPELVHLLRLSDGPEAWALAIEGSASRVAPVAQTTARRRVHESGFDIRRNAAALMRSYERTA